MREVCDACVPRPGDNRYQKDANEDRATDPVEHKEYGEDTADKYTEPCGG